MRVLITGAAGFVGRRLVRDLRGEFDLHALYRTANRHEAPASHIADVSDKQTVAKIVESVKPDAIIHAAAVASVTACEKDPDAARRINVTGTANVVEAAKSVGAYLVYLSTDMVFDGRSAPYSEIATPSPLSVYGETKAKGEAFVPADSLVLRLALGYGRSLDPARPNFFEKALRDMKAGRKATFFRDEWRTPLWVGDAVRAIASILKKRPAGVLHLAGPERMSRSEMAARACAALGIDSSRIEIVSRLSMNDQERPEDLTFDTSRFRAAFPEFEFTRFEDSIKKNDGGLG